jgi:flagellin
MSLGVLNNLNAVYAENNLNNTSSSLSKVLNQLSSGSKINSGADDAAGLSLVNGLQANSMALAQSQTNAAEGVGLLTVADGALSQVTNLLNRAVTLATEASNGTLNSSQDNAAENEYSSILSEINNIGTTTTYNQQQVFGSTTSIYTGDSSAQGASIDSLNIRSLSSSNVGDTNGAMSYSNGTSNVFINLSNGGSNAAVTDSLGASSATTTINVGYMTAGAGGSAVSATAAISVGAGTNYSNTAQGLISAINNSGLGLNASFSTATQAGSAAVNTAQTAGGSGTDTGIEISAAGIGTGTNGVGVVGSMALDSGQTLSGTLNIVGSDGTSHNIALGTADSTDNLNNLASTINAAAYGVTASVNQAGTQLTFTSASSKVAISGTNIQESTTPTSTNAIVQGSGLGSLTVGGASDTLTGTLNLVEGSDSSSTASAYSLAGKTIAQVAADFTTGAEKGLGISATVSGNVLSFTKSSGALGTPSLTGANVVDTAAPSIGVGSTLGSLSVSNAGDTLASGTLNLTSGNGVVEAPLTLGSVANGTDTLANLAKTINAASYGITATLDKTGTDLTFTQSGGTGTAAVNGAGVDNVFTTVQNPISITQGDSLGAITLNQAGDAITGGTLNLTSADGKSTTTLVLNGQNLAAIEKDFNGTAGAGTNLASYGITAGLSSDGKTLSFTGSGSTALTETDTLAGNAPVDNTAAQPPTTNVAAGPVGTLGTLTVSNASEGLALGDSLSIVQASNGTTVNLALGTVGSTDTLTNLASTINGTAAYGITATLSTDKTSLTFTAKAADANAPTITSGALNEQPNVGLGSTLGSLTAGNMSTSDINDTFTGTLSIQEGVDGSNTATTLSFTNANLATIANDINNGGYGITASLNQLSTNSVLGNTDGGLTGVAGSTQVAAGTVLTFTQTSGDLGTASITNKGVVLSTTAGGATNPAVTVAVGSSTTGTMTVAKSGDLVSGVLNLVSGGSVASTYNFTGQTLQQVANSFNLTAAQGGTNHATGITAALNGAGTILTFTTGANMSANGTGIADFTPGGTNAALSVAGGGGTGSTITAAAAGDVLTGALSLTSSTATGNVQSTYSVNGQTLQEVANSFNNNNGSNYALGFTAAINAADTQLTFTNAAGAVVAGSSIADLTPGQTTNVTLATGTTQNTITVANSTDLLSGDINITTGAAGAALTPVAITGSQTLAQIAADFNGTGTQALNTYGLTATLNQAGTTLTFSQAAGDAEPTGAPNLPMNSPIATVTTDTANPLVDTIVASTATQSFNTTGVGNIVNTLTAGAASDQLTGTLNIQEGADGNNTQSTYNLAGQTLTQVAAAFTTGDEKNLGITANLNAAGTRLTFTQNPSDLGKANVTDATAIDDTQLPGAAVAVNIATSSSGIGSLTSLGQTDMLSGTLSGVEGNAAGTAYSINLSTYNLASLATAFDSATGAYNGYGITANLNSTGTGLTFTATSGDAGTPTVASATYTDAVTGGTNNVTVNHTAIPVSGGVIGSLSVGNAGDILQGTLNMTKNDALTAGNIVLGTAGTTDTLANLFTTINAATGTTGITAALTNNNTTLTLSDNGTGATGKTASVQASATVTDYTPIATAAWVNNTTVLGSFTVQNLSDSLTGVLNIHTPTGGSHVVAPITLGTANSTDNLTDLANTINTTAAWGLHATITGTTMNITGSGSGDAGSAVYAANAAANASTVGDVTTRTDPATVNTLTVGASNETLSGILNIATGSGGVNSHVLTGQTIDQIAANFNNTTVGTVVAQQNWSSDGITASVSGNTLTFAPTAGDGSQTNVSSNGLTDTIPVTTKAISVASGTMQDNMSVNNAGDTLGGTLNITSGITGQTTQLALGTTTGNSQTDTLAHLAATINATSSYGVSASLNTAQTQMTLTQISGDGYNAAVGGASVTDTGGISLAPSTSLGSLGVGKSTDTLTGILSGVGSDGKTAYNINLNQQTLAEVESTINANAALGITASVNKAGTQLSFTADAGDNGTPTIANYGNIVDTAVAVQTAVNFTNLPTSSTANSSTLGSVAIGTTNTLGGSLKIGGTTINIGSSDNSAATLVSTINKGNYGVTAAYSNSTGELTFTSPNSAMAVNTTSLTQMAPGSTIGTSVGSLTGASTSSNYYSLGITGSVTDTSTAGGTGTAGMTTDLNGSGGTATISYTDAAGQSLSSTSLANQTSARAALTALNAAITDVAAQDGYIGAQINTLNAVSSVLATQAENVTSAQNAVQATDYASATSNMSKYEILSQTGISALAQANSQQREVTKLLQ